MSSGKPYSQVLVAAILSWTSIGATAQSAASHAPPPGALELEIQFKRVRNAEDLRSLCPEAGATAASCLHVRRDASGSLVCVIVAIEPLSFNDVARLVAFGQETLNCLAARAPPMAVGVKR